MGLNGLAVNSEICVKINNENEVIHNRGEMQYTVAQLD